MATRHPPSPPPPAPPRQREGGLALPPLRQPPKLPPTPALPPTAPALTTLQPPKRPQVPGAPPRLPRRLARQRRGGRWLAWAFIPGLTPLSWLHAAIRARSYRPLLPAAVYLIPVVVALVLPRREDGNVASAATIVLAVFWVVGLAHVIAARRVVGGRIVRVRARRRAERMPRRRGPLPPAPKPLPWTMLPRHRHPFGRAWTARRLAHALVVTVATLAGAAAIGGVAWYVLAAPQIPTEGAVRSFIGHYARDYSHRDVRAISSLLAPNFVLRSGAHGHESKARAIAALRARFHRHRHVRLRLAAVHVKTRSGGARATARYRLVEDGRRVAGTIRFGVVDHGGRLAIREIAGPSA